MDRDKSFTLWTDLVNTRYLHNGHEVDDLQTMDRAQEWLQRHFPDMLPVLATDDAVFSEHWLGRLRELRDICLDVASTVHDPVSLGTVLDRWNQWMQNLHLTAYIIKDHDQLHEIITGVGRSEQILWRISHSLAETLRHYPLERIRQCEHDECIRYFVDTSRGGHRRWCDMATCGNRQKVARYRAKR
ncbi:CGNR zinc finger domain-containing protein [Sulfobacillus thermosulfidooxidans]|uniref:CGNR zinc finger domain-containing protein n=1 Tax=Sulfobacillus thermosulfidooxidans TaxID=28034 RepID=UPI0006B4DDFD|nr:CGNR zinc finger domain-containing protein [Sulfobacillus thermosulfidooxidans]